MNTDVGYRGQLAALRSLHRFQRPLVLLMATLPPPLVPWLRRTMLVPDAVLVRDRTTKLNVHYRVEVVRDRDAVLERAAEVVRTLTAGMVAGQKGVVYCRSRAQCCAVAETLKCGAHHSNMTDDEQRTARDGWVDGTAGTWIAATSGLGTGMDSAGIEAVVHAGTYSWTLRSRRGTGRGGRRAGETVQSVVVHDGWPGVVEVTEGHVERVNREAMQAFLTTTGCRTGCRRAVLGAFLDGVEDETYAGLAGAAWCDRCQARPRYGDAARGDMGREGSPRHGDVGHEGSSRRAAARAAR